MLESIETMHIPQENLNLKNNLPEICIPEPGLMQINGLYRHGYLIAPAMMDAALQVLRGESQTLAKRFDLQIQQATLSQSLV